MWFFVKHQTDIRAFVRQYQLNYRNIAKDITLVNMEEEIERLYNLPHIQYIEEAFRLGAREAIMIDSLLGLKRMESIPVIIAYIGEKLEKVGVDGYYNLSNQQIQWERAVKERKYRFFNLYAEQGSTNTGEVVLGTIWLLEKVKEYNMPLLLYSNFKIEKEEYPYRSCFQMVMNQLVEGTNTVMINRIEEENVASFYIPTPGAYGFYIENTIYTKETFIEAVLKCIPFVQNSLLSKMMFKRMYQQKNDEEERNV